MTLPKTICMLPWVSIETSPIGTVRPCCLAVDEITDAHGVKYNLRESTLEEVYNSDYMQTLRAEFLTGGKPSTCNRCWEEEAAGRASKRINSRIRLKELYTQVDWQNPTPDQLWFVDLKLGNICNLKCRICGSWSSSKWAEEEMNYDPGLMNKKEHLAYAFLKGGRWPRESDKFWENLKCLLPNIKYFEFTGGEPWLIREHFDLLQYAADHGYAHGIDIHYNTNGTQYPEDAEALWNKFKRVDIAFSVDNIGDRFEYERYGAQWQQVQENINKAHALRSKVHNVTTQLCFTVNIQNVYYLEELLNWAHTKSFNSIHFNMLHDPKDMCITQMTAAAKQLVIQKLQRGTFSPVHQQEISKIINFIENGAGSDGAQFLAKMQRTDEYRKQSFILTHPEIARTMGYE